MAGLLSSLMLTIAVATPVSFDVGEPDLAIERFNSYPYNMTVASGNEFINTMFRDSVAAMYLLCGTVLMTVLILVTNTTGVEGRADLVDVVSLSTRQLWLP